MKAKFYLPLLLCLLALWFPHYGYSQIEGPPARIDYQGHLLDNTNHDLSSGVSTNYTIEFRIYDAQSGGTLLWAEKQTVTVLNGDFSVRLGEGVATADNKHDGLNTIFNGSSRYLGVTLFINGASQGEIQPRLAFLTSPYSFAAEHAKTADSVSPGGGPSFLAATSVTSLQVTGATTVNGNNYLQFAGGVSGKDPNSGKIGYQLFPTDPNDTGLDIIGVGTNGTNRKVQFYAEGGASFNGGINVAGPVTAPAFTGGTFSGNGAALTQLAGSNLVNQTIDVSKLVAAVQNALCPTGTIIAYAGDVSPPPAGWIACDGSLKSRVTESNLFNAIGTRFGTSSSSDFRVPDLRGRFLRGRDGGAGNDPNAGQRSTSNGGGAAGDNVGSFQSDDLKSHQHQYGDIYSAEIGGPVNLGGHAYGIHGGDTDNDGIEVQRQTFGYGGNETRPVNISVNYLIKN